MKKFSVTYKGYLDDPCNIRVNGKRLGKELSTGCRDVFQINEKYVINIEFQGRCDNLKQCRREWSRWTNKISKSKYRRYFAPTIQFGKCTNDIGDQLDYSIHPFIKGSHATSEVHFEKAERVLKKLNLPIDDVKSENVLVVGRKNFCIIDYGV